jgi:hypothetical protein
MHNMGKKMGGTPKNKNMGKKMGGIPNNKNISLLPHCIMHIHKTKRHKSQVANILNKSAFFWDIMPCSLLKVN